MFYSANPRVQSYEPLARKARAELVASLLRRLARAITERRRPTPARRPAACQG